MTIRVRKTKSHDNYDENDRDEALVSNGDRVCDNYGDSDNDDDEPSDIIIMMDMKDKGTMEILMSVVTVIKMLVVLLLLALAMLMILMLRAMTAMMLMIRKRRKRIMTMGMITMTAKIN
jgi:hypothetical protein